ERIHTGEKPYQCPFCPHASSLKENLKSHIISQHRGDEYACCFCGKVFIAPAFLRRHIRTHTGEKPFGCPHCSFRAAQKGNLNTHIINKHTIRDQRGKQSLLSSSNILSATHM
ncbi:UNVERIFIED_CONTAM: hypothetical protein GTU68_026241, partial [Idotea baltica]|nr:hypothetical protein [Idotea baltica]